MKILEIIKPFLMNNKLELILYIIFILLSYPLESTIIPKVYSSFFDELKTNITDKVLFKYFKILFSFMFIILTANFLHSKLETHLVANFNEILQNTFFEKILYFYENNYSDLELGKIITRINTLPAVIRELTTDLFSWVIPKFLTVLIINIYLFTINKKLGCMSLLFLVCIIIYNMYAFTPCVNLATNRHTLLENKSEQIQDKLSNLFNIYSAANADNEIKFFKNINEEYKVSQIKSTGCNNGIKNINNILVLVIFLFLCIYSAYLFKSNAITNKELITIYITSLFYIQGLNNIVTYLPDYTYHLGIISNVSDFLDDIYTEQIKKPDINILKGKIEIKNLTFGYNNTIIFDNFNLTINASDKIGIVGSSGNGKSTLIKLIMGYYKIDDNMIFIDGQDINKHNLKSLRKNISYINQNTKLFNKSIYENIQYGNTLTIDDIDKLYDKFKLNKIFKTNLNMLAGPNGDELSGGQRQIIHLLKIYNKNNKIMILDEPTSALDDESKKIIIDIIKTISKNNTLIIITHDLTNLNLVKNIITIKNGKISE